MNNLTNFRNKQRRVPSLNLSKSQALHQKNQPSNDGYAYPKTQSTDFTAQQNKSISNVNIKYDQSVIASDLFMRRIVTIDESHNRIDSNQESIGSSRSIGSLLREFDNLDPNLQDDGRIHLGMANEVLNQKYLTNSVQGEAVLFLIIALQYWNISSNYSLITSDLQTGQMVRFYSSIVLEWLISAYYTYDAYYKLKNYKDQYYLNIILNLLSGPVQFILDISYFIRFKKLYWLCIIFKSLRIHSTQYQYNHLKDIYKTLLNCLPLIFAIVVYFFIFTYIFTLFFSNHESYYFKNFAQTSFTLLEFTTVDGSADTVQSSLQFTGNGLIGAAYAFIFLFTIFFQQILQAFQIDILILDSLVSQGKVKLLEPKPSEENINIFRSTFLFKLIYGQYYTRFTLVIWVTQLYFEYNEADLKQTYIYILLNQLVSLLYTVHFMLIIFLQTKIKKPINQYQLLQISFHFLSGPFALIAQLYELSYYQHQYYSSLFLLLKILTNQNIKDFSFIALTLLYHAMGPYLCMFVLTLVMVQFEQYSKSNSSYESSFLHYLQLMTLDDWDGSIFSKLSHDSRYFQAGISVIFLQLINYILIPAFIAIACEIYTQILGMQLRPRLQNEDINPILYQSMRNSELLTMNYQEDSKFLIAVLLKYQPALFYPENINQPLALRRAFEDFLMKSSRRNRSPKKDTITINTDYIVIRYKNQLIKVKSKQIRFK